MESPRKQVYDLACDLASHINSLCSNPQIKTDPEWIVTLHELKRALLDHDEVTDELIIIENEEDRKAQRLPLSCALVVSQQTEDMIVNCFTTYYLNDGITAARPNNQMEARELIEAIVKTTENVRGVLRKHSHKFLVIGSE